MATWIAHMRIAEALMLRYPELDNIEFIAGNIAPDCGVPNDEWTVFDPPKNITHFYNELKMIDAELFKERHLHSTGSFYLGYYFHLLTDLEWVKLYNKKKLEPLYRNGLANDLNFTQIMKKDWYGQDHLYLQRNPESVFFRVFSKIISFENTFLDFFPADAFTRQFNYITNFYSSAKEDANREFPYLSRDEMDTFVDSTSAYLETVYRGLHN